MLPVILTKERWKAIGRSSCSSNFTNQTSRCAFAPASRNALSGDSSAAKPPKTRGPATGSAGLRNGARSATPYIRQDADQAECHARSQQTLRRRNKSGTPMSACRFFRCFVARRCDERWSHVLHKALPHL